ncbi:hypothetical protein AC579_2557 [Pseudocercospora musae]|uniref:Uncharacterized protein n=1 Tax=Pseudocercospora musae TaxID=113226 RepID=A0A139I276_9PEZI|nr:hypothetical protein AC579_2557 [Pseudocercospora musae]
MDSGYGGGASSTIDEGPYSDPPAGGARDGDQYPEPTIYGTSYVICRATAFTLAEIVSLDLKASRNWTITVTIGPALSLAHALSAAVIFHRAFKLLLPAIVWSHHSNDGMPCSI